MIVTVIKEGDEKAVLEEKPKPIWFIEQANDKPIVRQSSYGRITGWQVLAFVPACMPSVSAQVSVKDFTALASCYENTILAALNAGAKTVAVKQFGVGRKVNMVYEDGVLVGNGVWGDLYWTIAKSAHAASLAVKAADGKAKPDAEVVFMVPPDAYAEWSSAMTFG